MKTAAVTPNQNINATQKGKKIGGFVGLGAGSIYAGACAKDTFVSSINAVKQANVPTVIGKASAIAVLLGTAFVPALAGKLIGGLIGKAIDNKAAKNQNIEVSMQSITPEKAQ